MTSEVERAIDEIRRAFSQNNIEVVPEAQGGAEIVVQDLVLGDAFVPPHGWIGFRIDFQYPRSDVYPHFIDGSVCRKDGGAMGEGFSQTNWRGKSVWQISRKSKRWDPAADNAATKLAQVLEWLRTK